MTKEQNRNNDSRLIYLLRYTAVMFALALTFVLVKAPEAAQASTVNYTINYETQLLDASLNSGRVYLSTDNQKTWDSLEDSGSVVDLSSLLKTKETYIFLKTNNSTTATKVTLMAEPTKDITVTLTGGSITYSNTLGIPIEYQKGKNAPWVTLGVSGTMNTKPMEIKGATISFRTKAIATRRAGKIVTIKVSKKPTAPSVKLDGGKLSITGLKTTMQYRTPSSSWLPVTLPDRANSLSVYYFGGTTSYTNATYASAFAATTLEFRIMATDKKPASSSRVVVIPAQPTFTGSVTLVNSTLKVLDSTRKTYEYTVLEPNTTLDLTRARWTSLSPNKDVILKNVSVNQVVLIRVKSYVDKTTKLIVPASTVVTQTITGITLPVRK